MRRTILVVALLLLAPLASAQVYKWTDAKGTVHYSQSPPPQGTTFKKIHTSGSASPLAASAPEASSESAGGSMEPSTQASQPVADTPENRTKLCASLKSNLATLQGSGPVVMEQGGQPRALNDAERAQQVKTAQSQYQQYCQEP